jgi:hypothetical protein
MRDIAIIYIITKIVCRFGLCDNPWPVLTSCCGLELPTVTSTQRVCNSNTTTCQNQCLSILGVNGSGQDRLRNPAQQI